MTYSFASPQEVELVCIEPSTKKFSAITEHFHSHGTLVAKTYMLPDKPYRLTEKCSFGGLGIFLPSILVWE